MPSIASSKVTMTTILSQLKAGLWKRKEQTAFYDRFQPSASPGNKLTCKICSMKLNFTHEKKSKTILSSAKCSIYWVKRRRLKRRKKTAKRQSLAKISWRLRLVGLRITYDSCRTLFTSHVYTQNVESSWQVLYLVLMPILLLTIRGRHALRKSLGYKTVVRGTSLLW